MARGHQKLQSQAKAQEKAAKIKKQQGHSANDQKKAAQAGLKASCTICKVTMTFLDMSPVKAFLFWVLYGIPRGHIADRAQ